TWARAPEDEHRLLWRVLAALVKSNPLPRDLLRGGLVDQPGPVTTSVAQPDQMPSNFADLWQGLENRVRPGLTYVVTLVLDPEVASQAPLVLKAPQIGIRQIASDDARSGFDVRGWVRNRDNVVEGLPGVMVMVEETGARTTTDEQGWFRLPVPRRGSPVLVLMAQGRAETKVTVTVPGQDVILEL
ncbi:MAG: Pvc16 family protein, partial [Chloroflexota bacterium]